MSLWIIRLYDQDLLQNLAQSKSSQLFGKKEPWKDSLFSSPPPEVVYEALLDQPSS